MSLSQDDTLEVDEHRVSLKRGCRCLSLTRDQLKQSDSRIAVRRAEIKKSNNVRKQLFESLLLLHSLLTHSGKVILRNKVEVEV
jgi:hypothetical protein